MWAKQEGVSVIPGITRKKISLQAEVSFDQDPKAVQEEGQVGPCGQDAAVRGESSRS